MTDAKENRQALLEKWIQMYSDQVLRVCFLYLADHALAEDAAQDTFIKAWRHIGEYKETAQAHTWLMRIAINTCKDYKKSAWFRHVDFSRAVEELPPALLSVPENDRTMLLDVMALPDKYKQAVLLYYYQDMSLLEAAQALGISRTSILRRLRKAYDLLRCPQEGRGFDEE